MSGVQLRKFHSRASFALALKLVHDANLFPTQNVGQYFEIDIGEVLDSADS